MPATPTEHHKSTTRLWCRNAFPLTLVRMALLLEKSKTLHALMLQYVHEALRRNRGNKTNAAKELGVTVRCIRNWITKFDELGEFRRPRSR